MDYEIMYTFSFLSIINSVISINKMNLNYKYQTIVPKLTLTNHPNYK